MLHVHCGFVYASTKLHVPPRVFQTASCLMDFGDGKCPKWNAALHISLLDVWHILQIKTLKLHWNTGIMLMWISTDNFQVYFWREPRMWHGKKKAGLSGWGVAGEAWLLLSYNIGTEMKSKRFWDAHTLLTVRGLGRESSAGLVQFMMFTRPPCG